MKLIDQYKIINKLPDIAVPWVCTSTFGEQTKNIGVMGNQICLGEDYKTLEEARKVIEWYADQLGGSVKWKA